MLRYVVFRINELSSIKFISYVIFEKYVILHQLFFRTEYIVLSNIKTFTITYILNYVYSIRANLLMSPVK